MIFELYENKGNASRTYFAKDSHYEEKIKNLEPGSKLVFSYDAKSLFEAMQAYNDFLGYGKWAPEPEWEDTFYDS